MQTKASPPSLLNAPYRLVLFAMLVWLGRPCWATSNFVKVCPPPPWVHHRALHDSSAGDRETTASGFYYLLVDHQVDLRTSCHFRRLAVKLLTSEGVQQMSDLSVSFDPAYQKLLVHSIGIIRDGKMLDKLKRDRIKVVQREPNMDRYLYDGMLTAVTNLSDVHVGDIIHWSYSVQGENPVFGGKYYDEVYLRYAIAVEDFSYRLIVPRESNLRFNCSKGAATPEVRAVADGREYCWRAERLAPLLLDPNTPVWYDPFPSITVSEYQSWEEVVRLFAPLYRLSANERSGLKKRLSKTIYGRSEDSIVAKALRFVQDDIRYLAFMDGVNSHRPVSPSVVLERRFGDCKAKSFLLAQVLSAHGLEASPVLVNTYDNREIPEELPAPNVFNHCIVKVSCGNGAHFVDPTLSLQGGDLEHRYLPDYRYGLVLNTGVTSLDKIPFSRHNRVDICEDYTLDRIGGGAELRITTTYEGCAADNIRSTLNSTDRGAIERSYVDFYSSMFPTIGVRKPFRTIDCRDGLDRLVVIESYMIDSVWRKADTVSRKIQAEFRPLCLDAYVANMKSASRTMPFAVNYPVDWRQTTTINLPEDWPVRDDSTRIAGEEYSFTNTIRYANRRITLAYAYKTFVDYVEADKAGKFISQHNGIASDLSYLLTYNPDLAGNAGFVFSWGAALLALVAVALSTLVGVLLHLRWDTANARSSAEAEDMKGWIFVLGLVVFATPIVLAVSLARCPVYFNSLVWRGVLDISGSGRDLATGVLMAFELTFNWLRLAFAVFLCFLFVKKRSIFPVLMVGYLVVSWFVLAGDAAVSKLLQSGQAQPVQPGTWHPDFARSFVFTLIWISYLLLSKQVKRTFVVPAPLRKTV